MATLTKAKFKLVIPDHVEVAADMQEKFAEVLTVNATRINDRRAFKVGTSGDFNTKLAGPSSQRFAPMLDSGFVSRRGRSATQIAAAQRKNLEQGFEQYNDGLNLAFATVSGVVAKRFVDAVQNKKQNVSRELGRKTLRFVGDKIRGLGVAVITANLLVAEGGAFGLLRQGDEWLGGTPYMIGLADNKAIIKQGIVQAITRLGMNIVNADFDVTEMDNANDSLDIIMNALSDVTLVNEFDNAAGGSDSFLKFVKDENGFYVDCGIRLGV